MQCPYKYIYIYIYVMYIHIHQWLKFPPKNNNMISETYGKNGVWYERMNERMKEGMYDMNERMNEQSWIMESFNRCISNESSVMFSASEWQDLILWMKFIDRSWSFTYRVIDIGERGVGLWWWVVKRHRAPRVRKLTTHNKRFRCGIHHVRRTDKESFLWDSHDDMFRVSSLSLQKCLGFPFSLGTTQRHQQPETERRSNFSFFCVHHIVGIKLETLHLRYTKTTPVARVKERCGIERLF